jgi:hypothetical protein
MTRNGFFRATALAVALLSPAAAGARCADLALVLAIDASGSIDAQEFAMQMTGYATALTDADVVSAFRGAGDTEVAVVLWGDQEIAPQVIPWRRIAGLPDLSGVARDILALDRRVTGDTGIGRGLDTALDLLERQGCAARRVVNVSGDGTESTRPRGGNQVTLVVARKRAEVMGVTVNGLAILNEKRDLDAWYRARVMTGAGAFVMDVASLRDFRDALVRKLVREISTPAVAAAERRPDGLPPLPDLPDTPKGG